MMGIVKEHEMVKHLTEYIIVPEHEKRAESEEFRKAKERLKADGHYKCFISGATENLQVHHFLAEWCLEPVVDFDKLKELAEKFDPYGYGKLLKNIPMTSVDDIRNMLVLEEKFHIHPGTGIHATDFPTFIIQAVCKAGESPVEDKNELEESK